MSKTDDAAPALGCGGLVRRGWRFFECCGKWKLPTRDYQSPSGEDCPHCGEWTFPHHGEPDESLPCDAMGNLLPMSFSSTPNEKAQPRSGESPGASSGEQP